MMNNTINGRTPEEIKLGLVHCLTAREYRNCLVCPYGTPRKRGMLPCDCEVRQDILALIDQLQEYIQQLERERDELLQENQQLKRERDAAVKQLRKGGRACSTCKFLEDIPENDKICEECRLTGTKLLYSNWEWVGPQEVE